MLTCVNKECFLSNTNLGGTYELGTGRREAQSQFDKELNERVREEKCHSRELDLRWTDYI